MSADTRPGGGATEEAVEPSIKEQLNTPGKFVLIDPSNPKHLDEFNQWVLEFTANSLMGGEENAKNN